MLNKKALIDDWLPPIIAVIFLLFFVFSFIQFRTTSASAISKDITEKEERSELAFSLADYLRTPVDKDFSYPANNKVLQEFVTENRLGEINFADLIVLAKNNGDYGRILEYQTKDMFDKKYGENKWMLGISYSLLSDVTYGDILASKTYATKTIIPTPDKKTIKIQFSIAVK